MFRSSRSFRSFFSRSQKRAYAKGAKKEKSKSEPKSNPEPAPKAEPKPEPQLSPESSWITAEQIYKELSQRRTSLSIVLGIGSLVAINELSKFYFDSRYSLHPEYLKEDLLDYIEFSTLDSRTPRPFTDSIKFNLFSSFLLSSSFMAKYILTPGVAETIVDNYSVTDVQNEEEEPRKPAAGTKYLQLFPLAELCKDEKVSQRFIEAGLCLPLVQRMIEQPCDPLIEAFLKESKILRSLLSGPSGVKSLVSTPEFAAILGALEFEVPRRPYTVAFVLYSLIYHKESRDLLTPEQISAIYTALGNIYQQGRGDTSLLYASLGRKLIEGTSRPKSAWSPLDVEDFDKEHKSSPGVISRVIIASAWALSRWNRLGSSKGFTAVFWPQWTRLMIPKVVETYAAVQILSSSSAISAMLAPVEQNIFGGSAASIIAASTTAAVLNICAATFLIWRVPFVMAPTLFCYGWDFVYASFMSTNKAIGMQVHQYLDRMPLPYSEADLRKIQSEEQQNSKKVK